MKPVCLISAVCTLLDEEENLHVEGFEAHLSDQWNSGITSLFVAGSMGAMQLLRDETYRTLIRTAVELADGRGELLAGAGDTSYWRTRDRIAFLNQFPLDGVVVLTPFFFRFSQPELVEYFQSLAKISRAPLYLYDLPQVTGTKLDFETVLTLAKCPNIAGIKCSDDPGYTRQLQDRVPESFRVIIAQADLVDVFLRHGLREQLDGMFAMAPAWAVDLARAAEKRDWGKAAEYQRRISRLKKALVCLSDDAFTVVLNARGIPGTMAPRPTRKLSRAEVETLMSDPIVQEYIREPVAPIGTKSA